MFAFLNQAVTGVFLAMYYRPDATGGAYESIRYITDDAFLGQLVRSMHKWGASVMIILIFLHMARVFFFGAYKYPRELTWIIGVVLLILTLAMGFTGYLLPFDQQSYWATIVGVNINGTGPFIGPYLSDFLRAGPEFGATTLSRFYAIHMMLIPGLIAALIGAHLYLITKLGISAPPWMKAVEDEAPETARDPGLMSPITSPQPHAMNQQEKEQYLREYSILKNQGKPFFPYAVAKDSIMAVIVMAVIIFLALFLGADLGPKVDPTTTTYVPRPDWYFFFLFEVLRVMKNIPKFTDLATIGVPTICMILLFLLPFYDRSPERRIARRPVALVGGRHHDPGDGVPDLLGRQHRLAELGRPEAAAERDRGPGGHLQGGRAGRRPVGLPGLPPDRRQRQQRPGAEFDPYRFDAAAGGDRVDAAQPDGADAVVRRSGEGRAAEVPDLVSFLSSSNSPGLSRSAFVPRMTEATPGPSRSLRCGRCSTGSRVSTTCEHGDDRRAAPRVAPARRAARAAVAR